MWRQEVQVPAIKKSRSTAQGSRQAPNGLFIKTRKRVVELHPDGKDGDEGSRAAMHQARIYGE